MNPHQLLTSVSLKAARWLEGLDRRADTAGLEATLPTDAATLLGEAYEAEQILLERKNHLFARAPRHHFLIVELFRASGAIALGIFVACFVIFSVFVLLNLIFHFQF